jgi:hypothetical protein
MNEKDLARVTAAAHRTLDQIQNRWFDANEMNPDVSRDHYDGQAFGVYQMWVAVTGDDPDTPGRWELMDHYKSITVKRKQR